MLVGWLVRRRVGGLKRCNFFSVKKKLNKKQHDALRNKKISSPL